MSEVELALRFAAALGLGVLLGLERERAKQREPSFAGVRTFGLLALAGGVAGLLDVALARAVARARRVRRDGRRWWSCRTRSPRSAASSAITTEVSALLAFLLGFLCVRGSRRCRGRARRRERRACSR